MNIQVLSGTLPPVLLDPTTYTHYYPNASASLSAQGFVPISMQPSVVTVKASAASTGTGITCSVYDSSGAAVPVSNPSVSIDGATTFVNTLFYIQGTVTQFPAFGLWTINLNLININLVGLSLSYKPVFPMLMANNQPLSPTSTVIVS